MELENEGESGHRGDEDEDFEIKGIITVSYAGGSLMVDGVTVLVDEQTEFEGDSADLVVGTLVEVEGSFDADGNLLASEIELEDEADQEISGVVASIEAIGVNSGTVTLASGTVIVVTNNTIMEDDRDEGVVAEELFNLTHLGASDFIEVDVYTDAASGDLVAVKLERDDPES